MTAGFTVRPGSHTHWSSFISTTCPPPHPPKLCLPLQPQLHKHAHAHTHTPAKTKQTFQLIHSHLHNEAFVSAVGSKALRRCTATTQTMTLCCGNALVENKALARTYTHTHFKLSQLSVPHEEKILNGEEKPCCQPTRSEPW